MARPSEGPDWALARRAVAALDGEWTSYGDLAVLLGTGAKAMGRHLSSSEAFPHWWRVLRADGSAPVPGQRELLEAEGIAFLAGERADPERRVRAGELAIRLGVRL